MNLTSIHLLDKIYKYPNLSLRYCNSFEGGVSGINPGQKTNHVEVHYIKYMCTLLTNVHPVTAFRSNELPRGHGTHEKKRVNGERHHDGDCNQSRKKKKKKESEL